MLLGLSVHEYAIRGTEKHKFLGCEPSMLLFLDDSTTQEARRRSGLRENANCAQSQGSGSVPSAKAVGRSRKIPVEVQAAAACSGSCDPAWPEKERPRRIVPNLSFQDNHSLDRTSCEHQTLGDKGRRGQWVWLSARLLRRVAGNCEWHR